MGGIIFERVKSRRDLYDPSALERYIRSAVLPRFMQRLREIEDEMIRHRDQLENAYVELRESCEGDAELFAGRWRELADGWRFDEINELIAEHNEYYPIERDLPIDPRTGDYVTIVGRSYRREPLGPEWVLERFPPWLVDTPANRWSRRRRSPRRPRGAPSDSRG
jgi:hypothetical protein